MPAIQRQTPSSHDGFGEIPRAVQIIFKTRDKMTGQILEIDARPESLQQRNRVEAVPPAALLQPGNSSGFK